MPNEQRDLERRRYPCEQRVDRAVFNALLYLEQEPGEPFKTTRAAIIVESNCRPLTIDCSLYRLERDGAIRREAKRGTGTVITIPRWET